MSRAAWTQKIASLVPLPFDTSVPGLRRDCDRMYPEMSIGTSIANRPSWDGASGLSPPPLVLAERGLLKRALGGASANHWASFAETPIVGTPAVEANAYHRFQGFF